MEISNKPQRWGKLFTLLIVSASALCLSEASGVYVVEASTYHKLTPEVTAEGRVSDSNGCPKPGSTEYTGILGFRTWKGVYPATTTLVSSVGYQNGVNQVCGVYTNSQQYNILLSDYAGYLNNATTSGYYWTEFTFEGTLYTSSDFTQDVYYFTFEKVGSQFQAEAPSQTTFDCPTCTRYISHDPAPNDNVSTNTVKVIEEEIYVNEDDYNEGNTYVDYTYTNYTNPNLKEKGTKPVLSAGTSTIIFLAHQITATGTYSVVTEIYTDPWYWFKDSKVLENFNFYSGTTTPLAQIIDVSNPRSILSDVYGGITCEVSLTSIGTETFDCLLDYLWATVVPPQETLGTLVSNKVNEVSTLPPFGYAKRLTEVLSATSTGSTTAIAINVSFPSTSPMYGKHVTLNTSEGLHSSQLFLSNIRVPTIDGSPYEKFLTYWNTLWWIMFALWVIREIYGLKQDFLPTNQLGKKGALSDNSSTDDSYALKEWLYKHK